MFIQIITTLVVLLTTLFTPSSGYGLNPQYEEWIVKYALEYNVDPLDIAAIISVESNWNPEATNGWSVGLGGIVAKEAGETFKDRPSIDELKDPETNIIWTCRVYSYFKQVSNGSKLEALYRYSGGSVWEDKPTFIWVYWYKFLDKRRELEYAGFGDHSI